MIRDQYKPPRFRFDLPIIWVDTNVVIEMARARIGVANDDLSQQRGLQLYDKLSALTRNGKLIYLEAEQRREYGLNPKYFEECERLQSQLSQGIMVNHSNRVEQYQTQRMMNVYCGKEDQFHLREDDIFTSDPIQELERTRQSGFIISARFPISQEDRDEERAIRDKMTKDWEQIRQSKIDMGTTYKEQLNLEYLSHIYLIREKILELLEKRIQGNQLSVEELLNTQFLLEPLYWWEYATGERFDLKGLLGFMNSKAYQSIPIIDIKCKLYAYILTSHDPVSRGDMIDIEHLKTVLPYADVVITDRTMKHRLNQVFGSPNRYSTDVYSLRDLDDIIQYLNQFDE